MNVLIAPDKFKGTLTAIQVCDYVEQGLLKSGAPMVIRKLPLADGGEGTLDVFLMNTGGRRINVEVHDPLMRRCQAAYGLSGDGKVAFVELAQASGLALLTSGERNPLRTTTFGAGELFVHAMNMGVEKILVGIGGSATNDAALGALSAMGFAFFDKKGNEVKPSGGTLHLVKRVESAHIHPSLRSVRFVALCDVANPLHGETGAAYVYAPQKGASEQEVAALDLGLRNIAELARQYAGIDLQTVLSAGAGGGFAGGMKAFVNAQLLPGTEVIFQLTKLEEAMRWADLVITGEGKFDQQSLQGKLVSGVGRLALKHKKPALVVCGVSEVNENEYGELGISEVFALTDIVGQGAALNSAGPSLAKVVAEAITPKWITQ